MHVVIKEACKGASRRILQPLHNQGVKARFLRNENSNVRYTVLSPKGKRDKCRIAVCTSYSFMSWTERTTSEANTLRESHSSRSTFVNVSYRSRNAGLIEWADAIGCCPEERGIVGLGAPLAHAKVGCILGRARCGADS
jgi:hypothetical protein